MIFSILNSILPIAMLSDLWYTNIIIIICKSVDNLFVEQLTGGIVMNKKITIIYLVIAVLGIICTIFTALAFNAYVYDREPDGEKETVYFSDKMDMRVENGVYIYSAILPDITENKVIAYDTAHIFLDVTIDGEPVYTLTVKTGQWMKTTGYRWNFINLIEEDGGKEIIFRACPAYSDTKPKGEFYFGSESEVEHTIIKEHLLKFFVTSLILITSVILLIYTVIIIGKGQQDGGLKEFIIFSIMLGIWMICESQIVELYVSVGTALVFLDHLMLMLMPQPFLMFLRHMYPNKDSKLWSLCIYMNCGVAVIRMILQIMCLYDLRETLWLTHLNIAFFVVCVAWLSISAIVKKQMNRQLTINICCILVLLAATFLELLEYRFHNHSTPFGSLGFLFYVIVMGITGVKKSRKMMEQARESEIYRRLAFVDELTGVYNRTAFNRDLNGCLTENEKTGKSEIAPTVLYMFDLNDLKKCNDNFGHENGDKYIKMISEGLKSIFEGDGSCYRIGGDEFCAIAPFTTEKAIEQKLERLEKYVEEKRKEDFVVRISVAVGYAVYDPKLDNNLEDTMRRADNMMYMNKQEQKRRMAQIK